MLQQSVRALALAGALAAAVPAAAQAQTPAAATAKLGLAKRYIAAIHLEKMMDAMAVNMMPSLVAAAVPNGATPSPEVQEAISAAARESLVAMTPRMEDLMAPAIADTFSEPELKAAVTYYESPLGQSLMAKMPVYMAKLGPAMAPLAGEMRADMEARLCKKIACPAKPAS